MIQKISENDGEILLRLARKSIQDAFLDSAQSDRFKQNVSNLVLTENRGTFVTLNKNGQLRGCIGNIEPVKTIFKGVVDNARHAAFKDSRFQPMTEHELDDTQIEISILTRPEKLEYSDKLDLISKLEPNIDGVIIEKDYHKATFLPQVWSQLKTVDEFLGHLCLKAGIPADEWKTGQLEVFTYQVQMFEEKS